MSTPHRGLPPPSAMERMLPTPERAPPSNILPLGALPAAPTQWQGQDESMRSWLHAKSEEDRRKQEEEKTKQEGLRLDQRRIEQNMLQESLRGGIPPPMIPMVFASIGGGNVANQSVEWAQHYMAQISLQQQAQIQQQQQQQQPSQVQPLMIQQQQSSPEQRRDRLIAGPQPNPYGAQQMQPPPQTPQAGPQNQPSTGFAPAYPGSALAAERTRAQQPTLHAAPPTPNPRPQSQQAGLSRLNTGELLVQQPNHSSPATQHPLQQSQTTAADHQSSSPTLYFHHYVPPGAQERHKDKEHGTPSGKSQHTSPYSQAPGSHLRSEYTTSPKKRKANGPPHGAPNPSPSFSHHHPSSGSGSGSGRRRRSRQRSDASSRAMPHDFPARPRADSNRQSNSEGGSSSRNSAQPEPRPQQHQPPAPHPPRHPAGSDGRDEIRQLSRPLLDSDRNHSPNRDPQPSLATSA